jgi:uncharacterized protein YegP (UPF0339 family)
MAGNPHFELYERDDGQWGFRLKAANGEILAGSEGYSSKQAAQDGIEATKNAVVAIDQQGIATEVVD